MGARRQGRFHCTYTHWRDRRDHRDLDTDRLQRTSREGCHDELDYDVLARILLPITEGRGH